MFFSPKGERGGGKEIQVTIHYMSLKANCFFMDNYSPEKNQPNHLKSSTKLTDQLGQWAATVLMLKTIAMLNLFDYTLSYRLHDD